MNRGFLLGAMLFILTAPSATAQTNPSELIAFSDPTVLTTNVRSFTSIAFSRDGSTLVAVEDNTTAIDMFFPRFRGKFLIFDLAANEQTERLIPAGKDSYTRVIPLGTKLDAKLADDDVLAVSGPWPLLVRSDAEIRQPQVRIAGAKSGITISTFPYEENIATSDLAVSPARKLLALSGGTTVNNDRAKFRGRIQLRNIETGKLEFEHTSDEMWFSALTFSPDGSKLAAGSGSPQSASLQATPQRPLGSYNDGEVTIWDSATGDQLHKMPRLEGVAGNSHRMVESILFTPDGKTLVTGEMSGSITWWDAFTGEQLRTAQMNRPERERGELLGHPRILSLNWLGSGQFLLVSVGNYNRGGSWGELRVLDNKNGDAVHVLMKKAPYPINAVAVSDDGKRVAAGAGDGELLFWNVIAERSSEKP